MKKSDFLNKILKISREASERKRRDKESQISSHIKGGYNRMKEIIEKQAKNGIYWASMKVNSEYSSEIAIGIVKKFEEDGFKAKIKETLYQGGGTSCTIVEVYWSMLEND